MINKNEIPILEYDDNSKEVLRPGFSANNRNLPKKLLFAFLHYPDEYTIEQYEQARVLDMFVTITKNTPIYGLEIDGEEICVAQAPLGASASAEFLDQLIACGVEEILAIGSCGELVDFGENEFLLPTRALRDEGTSYHYLPAKRFVDLNSEMLDRLKTALDKLNLHYHECTTWTTDGFFRETEDMVKYRIDEGCQVVEMECAALAACAEERGAKFVQILYTADSLVNFEEYDERSWGKKAASKSLELGLRLIRAL